MGGMKNNRSGHLKLIHSFSRLLTEKLFQAVLGLWQCLKQEPAHEKAG